MEQTTPTAGATTSSTESAAPSTPATTVGDARAALALADATSTADPQTEATTPETTPAAAIAQPGQEATPAAEPSTTAGEPPKWRWQDILANTRETVAKETEQRIRQEFDGLKDFSGLSAQERAGLLTWQRALSGDQAAMTHVATVARSNPQVAQMLKGLMPPEPAAAPAADTEPEPDLQAADHTLVYSAPQLRKWQEWNTRRLTTELRQEFQKELQPLKGVAQTLSEREEHANYTATTQPVIAALKEAHPEFKAHMKDVWDLIQSDQQLTALALNRETASIAIKYAWGEVFRDKVLPLKQQQSEAKVLTDLQQRAVAATTNPATASTATPKPTLGNARAALEHAYSVTGS